MKAYFKVLNIETHSLDDFFFSLVLNKNILPENSKVW